MTDAEREEIKTLIRETVMAMMPEITKGVMNEPFPRPITRGELAAKLNREIWGVTTSTIEPCKATHVTFSDTATLPKSN